MDLNLKTFKDSLKNIIKISNDLLDETEQTKDIIDNFISFSSRQISKNVTDMICSMNLDTSSYAGFVITKVDSKTYKLYFNGIKRYSDMPKFTDNNISRDIQKTFNGVDMFIQYNLEDTHIYMQPGEIVISNINYHGERQRKLRYDYNNGDVKSLALYSTGADRMKTERLKQIWKYGYSTLNMMENPEYYDQGQLKDAAVKLFSINDDNLPQQILAPRNWDQDRFYKMLCEPYEERVLIAGSLLAAELDRLENINNYFKLPEKWWVKVTKENQYIINEWFDNKNVKLLPNEHICGICEHYLKNTKALTKEFNTLGDTVSDEYDYDFGKEITTEQFKKYVINNG